MATDKLRLRRTRARDGGDHCKHRFGCRRKGSVRHAPAVVLVSLLLLAWLTTAFAQDEGTLAPSPIPGPPTTPPTFEEEEAEEPEEPEEEVEEEERTVLPFLLQEPSLTESLMPDSSPDLNRTLLFPPNALAGLPRPRRALQLGRFAISSNVAAAATYDNFNPRNGDSSEGITGNLGAGVRADSQFERHSLGFGVNASLGNPQRSPGNTTPDRIAVSSGVEGELELTQRSSLNAEADFARGAQNPEAEEAGAQEQPTIYTASGAVAYNQRFNRLGWRLGGGINRKEADDGDQAAEQDRTRYTVSPGVNYRISRRLTLFANSGYSINRYDRSGEGGSRDSQIAQADVGANIGIGRTFSARLGVGYVGVFFDDSEREDEHQPVLNAGLDGAVGISLDRLTVLRFGLNHSTDQTTADDAALVTRTDVFASVNRPLTRASAILGRVGLGRSDFVDDNRTDHNIRAEVAYSHDLLRNIALNVSYRFSRRFSNEGDAEFYRNLVSVGLSASF